MGTISCFHFTMFKSATKTLKATSLLQRSAVATFSTATPSESNFDSRMFLAAGAALVGGYFAYNQAKTAMSDPEYPPEGLSANVLALPHFIRLGCGSAEYICAEKGATFTGQVMPRECPDLSGHSNFMTDALIANPTLYDALKDKKTALGVTLGQCIKTGIDNKGHPHIKTCGIVAGDEESWTLFAPLFDHVIDKRHNGYKPWDRHPTDMNPDNLSKRQLDPTGKYVLTTRCRTGRSVRGFRLPPCNSFEERRQIEDCLVKGLLKLDGELKGDYFPLAGSRSYAAKPNGMSAKEEEALRSAGTLFQEPDSTLLLSSGCGRHWPDARGIFHNVDKNFFVWINEEDHMRIISMEKGDNVIAIFRRFAKATEVIAETLKGVCARMKLQARGSAGVDSASTGGTWDISNADRLGSGETTLVNTFTEGVANIIRWEKMLENGE